MPIAGAKPPSPGLEKLVRRLRIDCGFTRKSSLLLATNRSHLPRLRREYEARAHAGFNVEWWDRPRIIRGSSLPQPAGILSPGAGQLDAYRLTHSGLLAAAQRRGARIYDRTTVTRTRFRRRGVELRTAAATACGRAIWSWPPAMRRTRSCRYGMTELHSTYALISEPVTTFPGWPADRCLIWETADPYVYLRTTPDGRIVIGGYDDPFAIRWLAIDCCAPRPPCCSVASGSCFHALHSKWLMRGPAPLREPRTACPLSAASQSAPYLLRPRLRRQRNHL